MKRDKKIIIKDPRLRKIRVEFRKLILSWVSNIHVSLIERQNSIINNVEYMKIQQKISSLESCRRKSICVCPHCGQTDRDMVYRLDWKQWLCVECNSEIKYFENLKANLQMSQSEIKNFFELLVGKEGVNLLNMQHSGINCGGISYPISRLILKEMRICPEVQDRFLELCYYYGGHCDCEIVLNTANYFLNKS